MNRLLTSCGCLNKLRRKKNEKKKTVIKGQKGHNRKYRVDPKVRPGRGVGGFQENGRE